MRLYVIGPVTGRENLNRKAFEEAKEKLWDAGYDVVIPHDVVLPRATHSVAMRLSIKTMLGCDGVAVLDDWATSQGATLEHDVAVACGLHVHPFQAWLANASSWAHRKPDCPEDDNSPDETTNPPSDGAPAPSNDVLGALARRMDETNALLRAMFSQLKAVTALSNVLTLESYEGRKDMTDRAGLYAMEAQACFESAGKENQDGEA